MKPTASDASKLSSFTPLTSTMSLREIDKISDLRYALNALRREGRKVACVPTMGALHEGHLSLIDEAKKHADVIVATIFVNPLQFAPTEDLEKYPRTFDADLASLRLRGATLVFAPERAEMYPTEQRIHVTAIHGDTAFEGQIRPGHFTGVLTVVAKIFNVIQPDFAIFGQKDLQQLSMIRQMVRDLNFPIEIVGVPIMREPSGLAMSSRNRYLSDEDRERAAKLYKVLTTVRRAFESGETDSQSLISAGVAELVNEPSIALDYLAIVDPATFERVPIAEKGTGVILAARLNGTRLIDNLIL